MLNYSTCLHRYLLDYLNIYIYIYIYICVIFTIHIYTKYIEYTLYTVKFKRITNVFKDIYIIYIYIYNIFIYVYVCVHVIDLILPLF